MLDRPEPDMRESGLDVWEAFAAGVFIILVIVGFAALIVAGRS